MTKIFFLMGLLFCSNLLASGHTVGNGGDIVICKDSNGRLKSAELLDFYEGRILKKLQPDLGAPELSVEAKIEIAIKRLERVSANRAGRYREQARSFFAETLFINAHLADISDAGNIVIPKECTIEQIANQSEPLYEDDPRYVIDESLWSQLDNQNRAGLILHEIIYREAIELGHNNSVSTRYLNANMSSRKIESMSIADYTRFLIDLDFTTTTVNGVHISIKPEAPQFAENGSLIQAKVVEGSELLWASNILNLRDEIFFFPGGRLQKLSLKGVHQFTVFGKRRDIAPYEMSFFESGDLKSFTLSEPSAFVTGQYDITLNGAVTFHQNGILQIGNIGSGWILIQGKPIEIVGVTQIHPNGRIKVTNIDGPQELKIRNDFHLFSGHIQSNEKGNILAAKLHVNSKFLVAGKTVLLSEYRNVEFFPETEKVKKACTAQSTTLKTCLGATQTIPARTVFEMSSDDCLMETLNPC